MMQLLQNGQKFVEYIEVKVEHGGWTAVLNYSAVAKYFHAAERATP